MAAEIATPANTARSQARQDALSDLDVFNSLPHPAILLDVEEWSILGVNSAAAELYGRPLEDFKNPESLCAAHQLSDLKLFILSPAAGQSQRIWTCIREDGVNLDVELVCARVGPADSTKRLLLATDITQRLRAERQVAIFSALGKELSSSRSPRDAAKSVASSARKLFGWDACIFERCSPDLRTLDTVFGIDTVEGEQVEVLQTSGLRGPIAELAITKGPQLIFRSPSEPTTGRVLPFGDVSRLSASIMAVPLLRNGRPMGIISVHSYSPGAYTDADLKTLSALAEHCAGAFGRLRAEDEIARLHGELRRHLEELQTLFAVAPVGIVVAHDTLGRKVTLNAACAEVFGLPPGTSLLEDIFNGRLPFTMHQDGEELPMHEIPIYKAAMSGAAYPLDEFEVKHGSGRIVHCLVGASPLFDETGCVRGSLGVLLDITERKTAEREILCLNAGLEQRVKDRTRQLEMANRELESFSYSVSHDLRAPLRSIRGFSEVLLERYSEQLDARGQEFLRRACDSCQHMERLIEDLLKLSRVNRSEVQPETVNISAIAEAILEQIRKNHPERKVETIVAPALEAVADERLLSVAMENLLRNAWKFTRDNPHPRIEVGRTAEPESAFFVRDNGAGFDMAYASKLFGVFQRLHSSSEFPGTGIGLATVQRVIHRHGGRVWASGAVKQGATFYFTLNERDC